MTEQSQPQPKGMDVINDALKAVEEAPKPRHTNSGDAIPFSNKMFRDFLVAFVNYTVENKAAIVEFIKHGPNDDNTPKEFIEAVKVMPDDVIASVYMKRKAEEWAGVFAALARMPPSYPVERFKKIVDKEIADMDASIAKHGTSVI